MVIEARDLVKIYHSPAEDVRALDGASLSVSAGEFVCVSGSSGSGKSTLLNVIAGLLDPTSGEVSVCGEDMIRLAERDRARLRLEKIGIVFQDHNLVPDFTAAENIEVLLIAAGKSRNDARREARDALATVGLSAEVDRYPRELSGGQAQRVGIARALAGGKQLILADEPTGALDRKNSDLLFEIMSNLAGSGVAVVLCTHDLAARKWATRCFEVVDGVLEDVAA